MTECIVSLHRRERERAVITREYIGHHWKAWATHDIVVMVFSTNEYAWGWIHHKGLMNMHGGYTTKVEQPWLVARGQSLPINTLASIASLQQAIIYCAVVTCVYRATHHIGH